LIRDEQQIKFYSDGVRQSIELYGTPSCKRKLITSGETSAPKKQISTNPHVQMIRDLFPDLDEKYVEVGRNKKFFFSFISKV